MPSGFQTGISGATAFRQTPRADEKRFRKNEQSHVEGHPLARRPGGHTAFLYSKDRTDIMRNTFIALALLAGTATSANAAVVVQQPGRDMLLGALSDIQFEDFEDAVLLDGLSVSGTGSITGGLLYRLVRADRPSIFTFAEPIFGFGGDIRSSGFGTLAITLTFEDGSQQQLAAFDISPTKSFLGFTSDVGITSIDVRSGTAGSVQYYLDDLSFGNVAGVPEPAQWAMLIFGFGMIGSSLRRRRTVQTHLA